MNNKVALVTGGTSGIGRSTALLFAQKGAAVALTGRRKSEGEAVAAEIEKLGGRALFLQADVSKESDCSMMIETTLKKFGRLDFAFNNAGVEGTFGLVQEQTAENFRHVFDINVLGVMLSMKYEIPAILKNGGAIVNNASIAGSIGMPAGSVYIASKHAVIGLTKCAALELGTQRIRVNSVSPGAVETEMYDRFTGSEETKTKLAKLHPIGRSGTPNEIAKAVLFLCSDDASFITGADLKVDGGYTVP